MTEKNEWPADPRLLNPTLSGHEFDRYVAISEEIDKRRCEALAIYEPLPFQDAYHRCRAKECILQKGNQAGGSVAGFVEVARAVTAQDPYDKYPKRDGVAVCLVYGERHIGRVVYRYLFRPGAFLMIPDEKTGEWRTYRPWPKERIIHGRAGDKHREKEAKPAPPLIPNRFIDGKIAFIRASERIFSYVRFTTGWELYALNSQGETGHAQGFQANLCHIDEDVARSGWYEEMLMRLSMRKGLMRWTALPHAKTDDMVELINRCEDCANEENPQSVLIRATTYDNPYYPEESRKENERILRSKGEEIYRNRMLGELIRDSFRMYPSFSKEVHGFGVEREKDLLPIRVLKENGWNPPGDWTRYFVFDPGHQVAAAGFFCVPPPRLTDPDTGLVVDVPDFKILFDECYIRNCDVHIFGKEVGEKLAGYSWQEWIIDEHGGRLRDLASGVMPKKQYEAELQRRGLTSEQFGPYFTPGSDDVQGREMRVREWLSYRPDVGAPTFLFNADRCPNFAREMERFRKKVTHIGGATIPIDQGDRRRNTHMCEVLEYAAAHGLPYVKPKISRRSANIVRIILEQKRQRELRRRAKNFGKDTTIHLGPRTA